MARASLFFVPFYSRMAFANRSIKAVMLAKLGAGLRASSAWQRSEGRSAFMPSRMSLFPLVFQPLLMHHMHVLGSHQSLVVHNRPHACRLINAANGATIRCAAQLDLQGYLVEDRIGRPQAQIKVLLAVSRLRQTPLWCVGNGEGIG